MAGRRKSDDTKQDQRASRKLKQVDDSALEVPAADAGWLPEIQQQWQDFWTTDLSRAIDQAQLPVLKRLFRLRNEQQMMLEIAASEPYFSAGSKEQLKIHPARDEVRKLEPLIVALEDRLGLSPKAKANLGLATGQAMLTVEHLNALAKERAKEMTLELDETTENQEHYEHFVRG